MYTPFASIRLSAIRHNLQQVRRYAPNAAVLAMLKANAYGHGILPVAQSLSPLIDALAVARLDEALPLRNQGITTPIVVVNSFLFPEELQLMARHQLQTVVYQIEQVQLLESSGLTSGLAGTSASGITVWLKINTGLNRLGFAPENVAAVYQRLLACPAVQKIILMTHFSEPEELSSAVTRSQIEVFKVCTQHINAPKSLAKSAAIVAWPQTHADWVRPGIMLYGVSPFANKVGADLGLRSAMTVQAHLISIERRKKGDRVGYHGTGVCDEDNMPVGIAAIGYGDGYPRAAATGTPVLANGKRCVTIGRVSMDLLAIDLRGAPDAKIGDPVTLWGEDLPIETVAAAMNVSPYALLLSPTSRLRLVHVD